MSGSKSTGSRSAKAGKLHLDAGEYVIGTMNNAERTAFEEILATNGDVRAHVAWWEQEFGLLTASISPQIPPETLWPRIEASLPVAQQAGSGVRPVPVAANDNVVEQILRSRNRWRLGTIAASVLAIGLGVLALNDDASDSARPGIDRVAEIGRSAPISEEYVAVVTAASDQPALIVTINGTTKEVSVRSLGVKAPTGRSLEVWYVPEGEAAVSVGLVGEGAIDLGALPAQDGDLLAISVEEPGGSPTGVAQGPIIYTGTLLKADE
jgi:anti-sigma-K factor RskA